MEEETSPYMFTTLRRRRRPDSQRPRRARCQLTVAACTIALTASSAAAATARPAESATERAAARSSTIFIGASGGSAVNALERRIGSRLARHSYGQLQGAVPSGRLVNMATNVSWRAVANARPGSVTYSHMARWADTLKSRRGVTLFTFSHEPEGDSSDGLGSARDFIAAFRRVQGVFKARGVRNVEYTWNMTSNSFRVPSRDPRYAPKWYPGDRYVDNVASAAYNWYNCGEGKGEWLSLANRAAAPLAFARSHGKKLVLAEWASQRGPRRAQWLNSARRWLLSNKRSIRAAFYYQSPTPRPGCYWRLTTAREHRAFAAMAKDRSNFRI